MSVFVVGSVNMDLVINADYMPENGMTISGGGFMTNPGGKGANQAVAIAKLGGKVKMVGCLGNAFSGELMSALNKYGVDTTDIVIDQDVSSGVAVIIIVDGDNRIILDAGANAKITNEQIKTALLKAQASDYMVTQLEIPLKQIEYALKESKARGLINVLNPAPAKVFNEELFKFCDYIVPNQSETEFYTGIYPDTKEKAEKAAEWFFQRGVKNVIITMGSKGSVALSKDEYIAVDAYKVKAIDTTAAGDTFVGAMVTKLSQGETLKSAMEFASRASAITVTRKGAQQSIPILEELL